MIKSNILTLVLLLVIVGSAVAVRSSSLAHTQGTGTRRWEYCAITEIGTRPRSSADARPLLAGK